MNKATFLDLGGTIIYDKGLERFFNKEKVMPGPIYVIKPEYVVLLPGALNALEALSKTDYKIIIITNQPAISYGYKTKQDFFDIMEKVRIEAEKRGARIDAFYYCPHSEKDNCECKKPKPGMLARAIKEHDISIRESWMIGDKTSDVKLGKNVGCKTALVKTGYAGEDGRCNIKADYEFSDLSEAAEFVVSEMHCDFQNEISEHLKIAQSNFLSRKS